MQNLRTSAAIAALSAGALILVGCATPDYVDKHVAVVQGQVTAMQGQQQTDDTHMAQLDQTAKDALNRANAANTLAQGKFMYSVVLTDDSVKFPAESAALSPEAQTRLMDFVNKLKADNKNVYVEIQGHTDKHEARMGAAQRLGEARAEAVRRFMSAQGVALNRMATISYGDDSPVAPDTTRAGRAQNRRVVVIVLA